MNYDILNYGVNENLSLLNFYSQTVKAVNCHVFDIKWTLVLQR